MEADLDGCLSLGDHSVVVMVVLASRRCQRIGAEPQTTVGVMTAYLGLTAPTVAPAFSAVSTASAVVNLVAPSGTWSMTLICRALASSDGSPPSHIVARPSAQVRWR